MVTGHLARVSDRTQDQAAPDRLALPPDRWYVGTEPVAGRRVPSVTSTAPLRTLLVGSEASTYFSPRGRAARGTLLRRHAWGLEDSGGRRPQVRQFRVAMTLRAARVAGRTDAEYFLIADGLGLEVRGCL